MEATPTTTEGIMKFFLRYKAPMLVLFAVTAMVGLSSCADTITGSEILKSEDAVQETATYNTYQKARVLPTPGNDLSGFDGAAGQPAIEADRGLLPDSSSTGEDDEGIPTPQALKLHDRF